MAEEKRFAKATWRIMEQLLEVDSIDDALSGSLEIIVGTLNSEAGAIWLLDPKTDRLSPMFHIGPADISGISVENGTGIEGVVTKTGKSVIVEDAAVELHERLLDRSVGVISWLFAAGITAVFAVVINAIVLRKIRNLKLTDM